MARSWKLGDSVYQHAQKERIFGWAARVRDENANAFARSCCCSRPRIRPRHLPVHQLARRLGAAGMAIYDTMQYIQAGRRHGRHGRYNRVDGSVPADRGFAPGKRYITPHTRVLLHQPWVALAARRRNPLTRTLILGMKELAAITASRTGKDCRAGGGRW